MTFRIAAPLACKGSCPDEIVADGVITLESADAFREIAARLAPNRIGVRLSSPGGNLVGGLQLGQALRELKATVTVGKGTRCVSACVYAFLGGTVRRVAAGGKVGVHRFRPADDEADESVSAALIKRTIEVLKSYVTDMGADAELIGLAASVAPSAVRYLDAGELRRYRVVN